MLLTAVCPVLARVHLSVAAVGEVVVAPPEQANVSAAGVKATGLTVMLTAFTAAVPVLGVAVSVPEYVAGPVAVVRVSVPQGALPPQDAG
jgi:hypothetical protein